MLPVVIIVSREAIRAVPPSIREGSLALGATQWQTIWKQVLPGSIAGIATGVDPGAVACDRRDRAAHRDRRGGRSPPLRPDGLDGPFTAMPIAIFNWTASPPEFQ